MTRNARIGFLAAAVVVLAAAFVIIGTGGDDDTEKEAVVPTATATVTATDTEATDPTTTSGGAEAETPTPEPTPTEQPFQEIEVKGGQPVGGIQTVEVDKGERVRYEVSVDEPHEIHTHGYDIAKDATPDKPARFDFVADADGIYEVELEDLGVQIAKLRVNP